MNASEARDTLLVRAFEAPLAPPWTEADQDWASREALRSVGSQAAAERLIAARAGFAAQRLATRDPAVGAALAASAGHAGLGALLLAAAFAAGVALDALGAQGRIEILSPPLLGLLAWNLAVYASLIAFAVFAARAPHRVRKPAGGDHRPLGRLAAFVPERWRRIPSTRSPALARFAADWAARGEVLRAAHLVALLHAGAALLALGALASLYLRGLVFEFRAGWDSTFLGPDAVHAIAAALYGPASAVSGIALPGADEIARLRFAHGSGENAARWIHLQALTVVAFIVLPRAVLAAVATAKARRLARRFPLPLTDAYYRRLRPRDAEGSAVCVLPYGYRFPDARFGALQRALEEQTAGRVALELAEPVVPGSEDADALRLPPEAASAQMLVVLFALTATPERETHGSFARAVAARHANETTVRVWIDETDFRAHFGADGDARRAQRRDAWRRMLADESLEPEFVDFTPARALP